MYCPWAKFISRGFTECCWPSRYILSCERFMCLKLYGFFLKEPLNASLSTHPMTILVGNCPVNKLSWVSSRLPPGMVKVSHTTLRMRNFALPAQIKKIPDSSIRLSNNSSSTTFISDAPVRNLGVTFDPHLSFSNHITNLSRSCFMHI